VNRAGGRFRPNSQRVLGTTGINDRLLICETVDGALAPWAVRMVSMRRSAIVAGLATSAAVVSVVVALGAGGQPAPSAVARALPKHYRLVLTEMFDHGSLHSASYGRLARDHSDAPLWIYSIRGHRKPPYEHAPEPHAGDRTTTVRGHPAVFRRLTDEGKFFAREFVWRERPDLVVAVDALRVVDKRQLRRVAEHVRLVGQRAWSRLHLQTSLAAQIGHVSKSMRHVRVQSGVVDGHHWRFFALVPAHFRLSPNDLRVPCFELRYRKRRGHGDNCGFLPSWQRVGGGVFAFGAVPRRIKHLRIRRWARPGFDFKIRTVALRRGPRVRYFATPLPENACTVGITPAKHPHSEPAVIGPISGRDQRRCARGDGP
jgi:hypothetical protein